MNIGISTTARAQSGDLAEVARQVEALGYDSLWSPEHPVVPVHRTAPSQRRGMDRCRSTTCSGPTPSSL